MLPAMSPMWPHCCPNVAPMLPQGCPMFPPRLPQLCPNVAKMLPQCGPNVAPLLPQCGLNVAPVLPQCCPNVAPMLPLWGTNVATKRWEALLEIVGPKPAKIVRSEPSSELGNAQKRAKLRAGQRPKASKAQKRATPKSEPSSEAGNAQKRAKLRSGQRPKASQAQKWAMPKLRNELPCSRSKPGKPRCFNMTRKNTPLKTNIINAVETRRATFGPHWGNIGATLAQHWGNIEEH